MTPNIPDSKRALLVSLMSSVSLLAACGGGGGPAGFASVGSTDKAAAGAPTDASAIDSTATAASTTGLVAQAADAPTESSERWRKSDSSWVKVATERSQFTLKATTKMRYGADTRWVYKTLGAGTYACTNEFFGSDPAGWEVPSNR